MLRGPTIRVPQLKKLLTEGSSTKPRLFDAAYTLKEPANHDEFLRTSYGCIDKLLAEKDHLHPDFVKEHLPGAVHFNLDIASYPGKYERASLYPPALFTEYVQRLHLMKGEPVVVYGRGGFGGMLFAARAWWLLKMYGMEDVAVLEGGLAKWKEEGGETERMTKEIEDEKMEKNDSELKRLTEKRGEGDASIGEIVDGFLHKHHDDINVMMNAGARFLMEECLNVEFWESSGWNMDRLVGYDDLIRKGAFERLDEVNMLDCRPADEFYGRKPLAFPPNGAPGARLPDSKCLPLSAVIAPNGELKSAEEIRGVLNDAGYDPSKPTYTMCNGGTQAALLGLALEKAGVKWSLFNGSLREVSKRDSSLIRATGDDKKT